MPNRLTHGETGGLKDVQGIDYLRIHDADTDIHRHREKVRVQTVALLLAQEFRILQPFHAAPAGQDHRHCHNRTGQRAPSGLIHTRHAPKPARPRLTLERVIGIQRHVLLPSSGTSLDGLRLDGGRCSLRLGLAFRQVFALGNPGRLAFLGSEVEQLGPPDPTLANHVDPLHHR